MSGSRPISLGWAWCALCFGTHQPKLIPINTFPTAKPRSRLARRERNTSWWPASCPTKPSWVNISPRNAAMASANHEFPSRINPANPAPNAPTVRGILAL